MKDESCPHYEVCTEMYGDEECAGWSVRNRIIPSGKA